MTISGAFEYRLVGEPDAAARLVADRIERALGMVRAREVERYGNEILFIGPAATSDPWSPPIPWKPDPASLLAVVARGEVEIAAGPAADSPGRVRYSLRTTRGLGPLVAFATAAELLARINGAPMPPFLATSVIGIAWTVGYLLAWIRVPLLLLRAADGELEPSPVRAEVATGRDAAT